MKKQVNIRLDDSSIKRMDALCAELEMNRTDFIEILLSKYDDAKSNAVSGEVVSSLIHQLEEKDSQIKNKDEQINQLMEQCRNFQVLIKVEQEKQVLLLPHKKVSWIDRLFGRNQESAK